MALGHLLSLCEHLLGNLTPYLGFCDPVSEAPPTSCCPALNTPLIGRATSWVPIPRSISRLSNSPHLPLSLHNQYVVKSCHLSVLNIFYICSFFSIPITQSMSSCHFRMFPHWSPKFYPGSPHTAFSTQQPEGSSSH